jgi:hypothetical protein
MGSTKYHIRVFTLIPDMGSTIYHIRVLTLIPDMGSTLTTRLSTNVTASLQDGQKMVFIIGKIAFFGQL